LRFSGNEQYRGSLLSFSALLVAAQSRVSHGGGEFVKRAETKHIWQEGADRRRVRKGSKNERGATYRFQYARNFTKRRADVAPEINDIETQDLVERDVRIGQVLDGGDSDVDMRSVNRVALSLWPLQFF
jgi:hypothetical protein